VTGGRASRQKGDRVERASVHALQDAGAAERVPLTTSGTRLAARRDCGGCIVTRPPMSVGNSNSPASTVVEIRDDDK
jgi:hypothetical protein